MPRLIFPDDRILHKARRWLTLVLQTTTRPLSHLLAGKKEMEKEIIMLEDQFPDAAKGIAEFSTPLAHQIIAGKSMSQPLT